MSKQSATKQAPRYKFAVFIASATRESDSALARLRKICDQQIPTDYEIEVFDLSKNPQLASDHNIIATPAIFRTLPAPVLKSIGNLSRTDQALLGLDLPLETSNGEFSVARSFTRQQPHSHRTLK